MGESKFKHFMQSVDKITAETYQPDIFEEEKEGIDNMPPVQAQRAAQLFTTAAEVFGALAKTFSGNQTTIEKDTVSGKPYLKIPIENQQVITDSLKALQGFLQTVQNAKQ